MKKRLAAASILGLLLLVTVGCASNPNMTNGVTRTGKYFGDLGIWGNENNFTVEPDSKLHKLSLIGDSNTVLVADGVTLGKIEFLGKNNTVSLPDGLIVRSSEIGATNRIIYRPEGWDAGAPLPENPMPAETP